MKNKYVKILIIIKSGFMMFPVFFLFIVLFCGKANITPGISGSIQVSSLNILQQIGIGYIGPKYLNKTTVLIDHVGSSNFLASLDIYDVHLRDDIDWNSLNSDIFTKGDNKLEITLRDFSTKADFNYIFSTWFSDSYGIGTVVIEGLKIRILVAISGDQSNWEIELEQEQVSFNSLHINLSSSILQALVDFVQSTIQSRVSNALRDKVLPPLNEKIYETLHSSNSRQLVAYLGDSGFFFNYFPSRMPIVSATHNYVEVYIDGLTYNNATLTTVATHDLTVAKRKIGAQDCQIYISDNTLTSLLHSLLVQFTHPYSQIQISEQNLVSTINMLAPSLYDYFGSNVTYIIRTNYSQIKPEFLIEKDQLTIQNLTYQLSLSGYNETHEEVKVADLSMMIEGVFFLKMTNNFIRGKVKTIQIVPGTFMLSSSLQLGRSKQSLESLINSTLKLFATSLGFFDRDISLKDLLPEEYKFLAATLLSFELSMDDYLNFALLGISLKLI